MREQCSLGRRTGRGRKKPVEIKGTRKRDLTGREISRGTSPVEYSVICKPRGKKPEGKEQSSLSSPFADASSCLIIKHRDVAGEIMDRIWEDTLKGMKRKQLRREDAGFLLTSRRD